MNLRKTHFFVALCGLLLGGSLLWAAEATVDSLLGGLKSGDEMARLRAIDELGARGPKAADAVAPLTDLLKDPSAKVRAHAVRALGEIGSAAKSAVPAIAELLKDPDADVRRQVVRAVMSIRPGPQVTVPLCIKLLEDSDPGVRFRILSAIADAGPSAVPGLIAALKHEKAAYWACLVLRELGPAAKDAVPALTEKLQDQHPEIRREAILALGAIGEAALPAVPQIAAALNDDHTAPAATYALGSIGRLPPEAESRVRTNINSPDGTLATTSMWALTRVHPEDKQLRAAITERLIRRLKDHDPFVRAAAARALAALPPAPEITGPIWETAMKDADETTVRYAMDALASMGPAAVPRLIEGLKYEKMRDQIAYVLGQIGPAAAPATPALANLLTDKNYRVEREAAIALAKIGPGAKAAVPALIDVLQQRGCEGENCHVIAYALGRIGPAAAPAIPILTDMLKGGDPKMALASAWALVHISPPSEELAAKTVPVLISGLDSDMPIARGGAAEALGHLGALAKEAVPALQKTAGDEDPKVRSKAMEAINAITGHVAN